MAHGRSERGPPVARVVGRVVMSDDEDDNPPHASEPAQPAQSRIHGRKRIFSIDSDTASRGGHQLPGHSVETGPAAKRVKLADDHVPHSPQASTSTLASHSASFADTSQRASPDTPSGGRPPPPLPLAPFVRHKNDQLDPSDDLSRGSSVASVTTKRRRAISFGSDEDESSESTSRPHHDPVKRSTQSFNPKFGQRRPSDAHAGQSSRLGTHPKSHAEQTTGPDDSTPPHRSSKQLHSALQQQREDQPLPAPERKRVKPMKLTDIVQASEARSTSLDPPTVSLSDAIPSNSVARSPQPEATSHPPKRKLLDLNDLVAAANERQAREQQESLASTAPAPSPASLQQDPKKKRGNAMSLGAILAAHEGRHKSDHVDALSDPPQPPQVFATAGSFAYTPPHMETIEGHPPQDESPRMTRARQTTSMELEHIRQEIMGSPPPPLSAAPSLSPVAATRTTFSRPRAQSNADNSPGLSLLAAVAEGASAPSTADPRVFKVALEELAVLEDMLDTQPECRLTGQLSEKQSPSASLGVGPHNQSSPEQHVSLSPVVPLSSTATIPRDVPSTTRERADLNTERARPRADSMKKAAARDERRASPPPPARTTGSKRPRQVVDSDDSDEEARRTARPPPKMSLQSSTQQDVKPDVKQEDAGAAEAPSAAPAPSKKKPMPSFKKKTQTKPEDDVKPKVEHDDRVPERKDKDKDKERGGDKKERDGDAAPTKKSAQPSSLPPRPGAFPPKPATAGTSTGPKERPLPPGKESKDVNVSQFLQNILGPSTGGGASTPSVADTAQDDERLKREAAKKAALEAREAEYANMHPPLRMQRQMQTMLRFEKKFIERQVNVSPAIVGAYFKQRWEMEHNNGFPFDRACAVESKRLYMEQKALARMQSQAAPPPLPHGTPPPGPPSTSSEFKREHSLPLPSVPAELTSRWKPVTDS